jgi:replicative DNA helicase
MVKPLEIFKEGLRPMQYWRIRAQDRVAVWKTGIPEGFSTGFRDLDKLYRLVQGELTLIAARPSMGKTAMGMQMVESIAGELGTAPGSGVVCVFSAEMLGDSLYLRMAAALAGVDTHKMRIGKGTEEEFAEMDWAIDRLRTLPIWIDDNSGPTTGQMLQQLAELQESIPIKAMLFDFLELGGDRGQKEDLRIGSIAQHLKGIAKTLEIPVIALSQLSREVEKRADKLPQLADLRYSGMLEQVSDGVLFIMRPEYYIERGANLDVPEEDKKGVAYVQVAKNRNGPTGLLRLAFVKDRIKFGDLRK